MAEIIGVVGSVAGLASEGLKSSSAIYSFYQKAQNADEDIKKVSEDVKNTAVIFRELEDILKRDARCDGDMHMKDSLIWSFSSERVTVLRNELDKCKLGVGLKIDVIRYKREVYEGQIAKHEREIAKKENIYNVRIEKHNIEIRKLKLEVAQQRYQHMEQWGTGGESRAAQSVNWVESSKIELQDAPGKANKNSKAKGKGNQYKSKFTPSGASSAAAGKAKGIIEIKPATNTTGITSTGKAKQYPKGKGGEDHPLQDYESEAGKVHEPARPAAKSPDVKDVPNTNDAPPIDREYVENERQETQPPMINGHTTTGSFDEAEAGPSTSPNDQAPSDEHDKAAGSSEAEDVLTQAQSSAVSNKNSMRATVMDNESLSVTSIEFPRGDDDEVEAGSSEEEVEIGGVHHDLNTALPLDNPISQTGNPQSTSNRPNGSTSQVRSLSESKEEDKDVFDAEKGAGFQKSKLAKFESWLRKARTGGADKGKEREKILRSIRRSQRSAPSNSRPFSRTQRSDATGTHAAEDQIDLPAYQGTQPPERDDLPNPTTRPGPALYQDGPDNRLPSSSLFPWAGSLPKRPFEGPPYESRNVRDRVNCSMVPISTQDTQTLLELWLFRRFTSPQVHEKSWGHISRDFLPLDQSELQRMVEKVRKEKVPIARAFAGLTSYQQRQVHLLILERDFHQQHFQWTLQAIVTFPKRSKSSACESIQVILERRLAAGPSGPDLGGPMAGIPPRPDPPNSGPMRMAHGPGMPQTTPPRILPLPPSPAPVRMRRPAPAVINNEYAEYEPPNNLPRPQKDPRISSLAMEPTSGSRQVTFTDDFDSWSEVESAEIRVSEPKHRAKGHEVHKRPLIHSHPDYAEHKRDHRRSDPKGMTSDGQEKSGAEDYKIEATPILAELSSLEGENDQRLERRFEKKAIATSEQGPRNKIFALDPGPRARSHERKFSRTYDLEPYRERKSISEESVEDLIAKWTVEDGADRAKSGHSRSYS